VSVLDHREYVHPCAGECDSFEEVTGQQDVSLRAKELCPGVGGALGGRVEAGVGEDLPHRGCCDRHAQDEKFTVDSPVAPTGVLLGQA